VGAVLNALLDQYERRAAARGPARPADEARRKWALRLPLEPACLPGYFSQTDPGPRQTANEQLRHLERLGWVKLEWLPGEAGNLLAVVTLAPSCIEAVFRWLGRPALAARRARLAELLLGERFRFADWRRVAVTFVLDQLRAEKSTGPFSLADEAFNRDLLTALAELDHVREETPYRVFSVRVFNDSKRFEDLMRGVVALARRGRPDWATLDGPEVLRELNLVANPGHLYLHGDWTLADETGLQLATTGFWPSVGVPAVQAGRASRVSVGAAGGVVCVENPTAFYALIRHDPAAAALCLWGNPSPACRHLLQQFAPQVAIAVWADLDYGGFNILAQLREQVSARVNPYLMDVATFEAHAAWARPLAGSDARNLQRLLRRASLADVHPVIAHLLRRGLKLEQEAISL
jgi:hypothetical protein